MGLGKVAIIGTGTIKFGDNFHQSLPDMVAEAATLAMTDAKIEPKQLQAAWFGCYEPLIYGFDGNSDTFVADALNLAPIPVTRAAMITNIHDQLLGPSPEPKLDANLMCV